MTTLRAMLAVALIAVTCSACQLPAPDDHGGGTVQATSAPLDLSVPDPSAPCDPLDLTLCVGDGLTYCQQQADGSFAWQHWGSCAPDVCISNTSADGHHQDFCATCRPGTTMCDSGRATRMTCGADYEWHDSGRCAGRCDCGGTYPHCKLCQ